MEFSLNEILNSSECSESCDGYCVECLEGKCCVSISRYNYCYSNYPFITSAILPLISITLQLMVCCKQGEGIGILRFITDIYILLSLGCAVNGIYCVSINVEIWYLVFIFLFSAVFHFSRMHSVYSTSDPDPNNGTIETSVNMSLLCE